MLKRCSGSKSPWAESAPCAQSAYGCWLGRLIGNLILPFPRTQEPPRMLRAMLSLTSLYFTVPTTTLRTPTTYLDTPVVFINVGNESFVVGDDVLLKCRIEKTKWFVTAQWIKHGTNAILTQQNFSASVLGSVKTFHTFHYVIYSLSLDDGGVYTCKAIFWNSSLQARSENYRLRVRGG